MQAYAESNTRGKSVKPGGAQKAKAILTILQEETKAVEEAREKGESVHEVYEKLGTKLLVRLIDASKIGDPKGPSYSDLLENNVDHFAPDSVTSYNAGHAVVLETAMKATSVNDLQLAYAINAFADHFLEDDFASGHLRVPRSRMIDTYTKSMCTNFMHNEDNDAGLQVSYKKDTSWKCYGDSMLLDPKGKATLQQCLNALRQSVQEVYDAYQKKTLISPNQYSAWDYAPQENIGEKGNHAPMFIWMPGKKRIYQRKGPDKLQGNKDDWRSYEDVVGYWGIFLDSSGNDYIYWTRLAYDRAQDDYYRGAIRGKLDSWNEANKISKSGGMKYYRGLVLQSRRTEILGGILFSLKPSLLSSNDALEQQPCINGEFVPTFRRGIMHCRVAARLYTYTRSYHHEVLILHRHVTTARTRVIFHPFRTINHSIIEAQALLTAQHVIELPGPTRAIGRIYSS